jgi:pyrroloquinoline quinone (PQQ) biosynthesis protein C
VVKTNWHLPNSLGQALTPNQLESVSRIEESFADHGGFRHPLWDWLATGSFELPALQQFAALYYAHVNEFRKYLAGAITVSTIEPLQAALAEVLAEEYGRRFDPLKGMAGPSHPDLYRHFMQSIGIDPADWDSVPPINGIVHYKTTLFEMFRNDEEVAITGAVIFGMESTTPYRHERVSIGLQIFGRDHGIDVDHFFFSRHVEDDPRHGQSLLMPIRSWLDDRDRVEGLTAGALRAFDARKVFLDDLQSHLGI